MPVPYHRTPRDIVEGSAAFLDVLYVGSGRMMFGGLLILDGRGAPIEFVHNAIEVPGGAFWPEDRVIPAAIAGIARSLFVGCRNEPDLLICESRLAGPEFCRAELAVGIPFLQVTAASESLPIERVWVNAAPGATMQATRVLQSLVERGLLTEPFQRVRAGLREIYGDLGDLEPTSDSLSI